MYLKLEYVTGDATQPIGDEPKVIAHIVNTVGMWGAGFSGALSKRYPVAERSYRNWAEGIKGEQPFWPGTVQITGSEVDSSVFIAHMLCQFGVKKKSVVKDLIDYEMLASCLEILSVMAQALDATVHMPMIGAGLAGGDWPKIESIIIEKLIDNGIKTIIYQLENN